jgi:hypothetical protein
LLAEAFEGFARFPSVDPALRARVTDALSTSYEQTNRPADAQRIRAAAATRPSTQPD